MKDRKTQDIDQLFREGLHAEKADFPVPEQGWITMQQRLDRYERRRRGVIWLTRVGSVAALLVVFFALGILITDKVPPPDEQVAMEKDHQILKEDKGAPKDSLQGLNKSPQGLSIGKTDNIPTQGVGSLKQAYNTQKRHIEKEVLALNPKKRQYPLPDTSVSGVDSLSKMGSDTLQSVTTATQQGEEATSLAKAPDSTVTRMPEAQAAPSSAIKAPEFTATEEPVRPPEVKRRAAPMALTVMAAPAYNGVNNFNNGSMGGDFGLLVSFEIARNWSVSTGGIYAKKVYESNFRDYNPRNNIWQEYYPQKVNADCRVLDIPVNLSYTLLRVKGKSISMGTGLSSYIMLREDYRFTYEEADPENPLKYSVVNQNRHWLNVVNLQATIGQQLGKRISISLQPYMKIPLGDIGFAGVRLQSMGLAVNVNWNFGI